MDLNTMSVMDLVNPIERDHYLVAAYDSIENMNKKHLIVVPELDAPTWILRPRARKATRKGTMALAVPSLDTFTLEIAQELTRVVTDFIVVREHSYAERRKGSLAAGPAVTMPWN